MAGFAPTACADFVNGFAPTAGADFANGFAPNGGANFADGFAPTAGADFANGLANGRENFFTAGFVKVFADDRANVFAVGDATACCSGSSSPLSSGLVRAVTDLKAALRKLENSATESSRHAPTVTPRSCSGPIAVWRNRFNGYPIRSIVSLISVFFPSRISINKVVRPNSRLSTVTRERFSGSMDMLRLLGNNAASMVATAASSSRPATTNSNVLETS